MTAPTFIKDPVGNALHFVHACCVCGAWGSFGYGVNLRAAQEKKDVRLAGKWFCAAHKAEVSA